MYKMQILSQIDSLSHGCPGIELPLGFLLLDFDVNEKFRRGDRLLTARDGDDPVPGARTVHSFLGYLDVSSAELLDLNDRLPGRSQDGAYQALAHLDVDLGQLVGVQAWRRWRWQGVACGGQTE